MNTWWLLLNNGRRAFWQTVDFYGWASLRRLLVGALLTTSAVAVLWYFWGENRWSKIPDWKFVGSIGIVAIVLFAIVFVWRLVVVSVEGQLEAEREHDELQQIVNATAARPKLEITYRKETHYTRSSDGVRIRITIRNVGGCRTRLSSVALLDIAPRTKDAASPISTLYHATELKIINGFLGMALDAGQAVHVMVVEASRGDDMFYVCGAEKKWPLPASKYEVRIVASSESGEPDERAFYLDQNEEGELMFKPKRTRRKGGIVHHSICKCFVRGRGC